jgi:hypothetical protein
MLRKIFFTLAWMINGVNEIMFEVVKKSNKMALECQIKTQRDPHAWDPFDFAIAHQAEIN